MNLSRTGLYISSMTLRHLGCDVNTNWRVFKRLEPPAMEKSSWADIDMINQS